MIPDGIFFVLAKLLGIALKLETWLLILAMVGFWANLRGRFRMALILSLTMVLAILGTGLVPMGDVLLRPLETKFAVTKDLGTVDGIVILGGGEDVPASLLSGSPQLGEGGDRYIAALSLARRYPEARLLFAGGSGRLRDMSGAEVSEAAIAERILLEQGIAPGRMLFESRSRNTSENARHSYELADPAPGSRWVLITSAFHMARAVKSFGAAGWDEIVPLPVDFRARDWADGLGWDFQRNLELTNLAVREWVGRAVYSLAGR